MPSYKQAYAALCSYVFISQYSSIEAQTSSTVCITNSGDNTWIKHSEYKLFADCTESGCKEIIYPGQSQCIDLDQSFSFFGLNYLSCSSGTDASVFYPYDTTSCSVYHAESFTAEVDATQLLIYDPVRLTYATNSYSIDDINFYNLTITSQSPTECTLKPAPDYSSDNGRRVLYYPGANTNEDLQYVQFAYIEDFCTAGDEEFDTIAIPYSLEFAQPNASEPPDWRPGSYLHHLVNLTQYATSFGYYVLLDCYGCGNYYNEPIGRTSSAYSGNQYADLLGNLSYNVAQSVQSYDRVIYGLMSHTKINGGENFDGTTHMLNLQNQAAAKIRAEEAQRNISPGQGNQILYYGNSLSNLRSLGQNTSGTASALIFNSSSITDTGPYAFNFRVFYNPDNLPEDAGCVSPVALCMGIQHLEILIQWLSSSNIQNIFFSISGGPNSNACKYCMINGTATLTAIAQQYSLNTWAMGAWATGSPMLDPNTEQAETALYLDTTRIDETYGQVDGLLVGTVTTAPSPAPSHLTTQEPSPIPSSNPSTLPSKQPSSRPSRRPSANPSSQPSSPPSGYPSRQPSRQPSAEPSRRPSARPSSPPSRNPSIQPSFRPTTQAPTNTQHTSSHSTAEIMRQPEVMYPTISAGAVLILLFASACATMRYFPHSTPGAFLWRLFFCFTGDIYNQDNSYSQNDFADILTEAMGNTGPNSNQAPPANNQPLADDEQIEAYTLLIPEGFFGGDEDYSTTGHQITSTNTVDCNV